MVSSAWLDQRLADIIVSLSFFALGVIGYLAVFVNIPQAVRTIGDERRLEAAYAVARLGIVIIVGLITEAVFRAGSVGAEWRSILYIIGTSMVVVGYIGVAIEGKRVRGK
jgi:zinc transporter ZupT